MTDASGRAAPVRERLPRAARIRRGSEIRRMFSEGHRRRTRSLDLYFRPAAHSRPRIGWVVPKLGFRIVDRNLLKRRVREIGRRWVLTGLEERGCGMDVLVRIRTPAYRATYEQLECEMSAAVEAICSDS